MSQEEVNRRMVEESRAGRDVCRLKGGDPAMFGRLADETGALEAAGIPYEIVPGVTAALALSSYAGIPLTHAELASAVAFVAGRERDAKESSSLDFAALAAFPGALVFYMGVTTVRHWAGELMRHGKSPDTPVALVRRCSWPDQSVVVTRLDAIADEIERHRVRPPALVVIGAVASRATATWFTARRLHGVRVLVTRPEEPADALRRELAELGAEVLSHPTIEIHPPADWRALDAAIERAAEFDWIVFSSVHGVRAFLDRLCLVRRDLRQLGPARLAAIGPATAQALADYRLRAEVVPETFRAESLAEALAPRVGGQRCLLVRASRGREVLAERLSAAGAIVEQVVAYESRDALEGRPETLAALRSGQIDWVTVTSSAIARSLAGLFGESLRQTRLVSISPVTSHTLRELGFEPAAEADVYTMSGLVAAIQ
jgi:uroporphyrinogen III methyltransferase/synthase